MIPKMHVNAPVRLAADLKPLTDHNWCARRDSHSEELREDLHEEKIQFKPISCIVYSVSVHG